MDAGLVHRATDREPPLPRRDALQGGAVAQVLDDAQVRVDRHFLRQVAEVLPHGEAVLADVVAGDLGLSGTMATRVGGSSDLYETSNRQPRHSVNFLPVGFGEMPRLFRRRFGTPWILRAARIRVLGRTIGSQ